MWVARYCDHHRPAEVVWAGWVAADWCRAASRWRGCPASSGAVAPWKCCSGGRHRDVAEFHGYVNRALPDAALDGRVNALAHRIASFHKQAITETKRPANQAGLPPDSEIKPEWGAFMASRRGRRPGSDQDVDGARLPQAGRCRDTPRPPRRPARPLILAHTGLSFSPHSPGIGGARWCLGSVFRSSSYSVWGQAVMAIGRFWSLACRNVYAESEPRVPSQTAQRT
jgi:hypothetical protein